MKWLVDKLIIAGATLLVWTIAIGIVLAAIFGGLSGLALWLWL